MATFLSQEALGKEQVALFQLTFKEVGAGVCVGAGVGAIVFAGAGGVRK